MKYYWGMFGWITCMAISCVEPIHDTFTKVPPGQWRGVLILGQNPKIIDTKEEFVEKVDFSDELPFNFEVKYTEDEVFQITISNGKEKITLDSIEYGRDKETAKDTLLVHFPVYQTYIKAIYEENIMEGFWYVPHRGKDYKIPFKAYHGQDHRFSTTHRKPKTDISGKWDVVFSKDTDSEYNAIGEFAQNGNSLTGTFLTETGDFRFLEGSIEENKFSLSTFDGTHAFLFDGKILEDGKILGGFRSGTHYETTWEAIQNEEAVLSDAFSLTEVMNPEQPMSFTFPDLEGKKVSLSDSTYQNKLKLIKISGSWCPNCKDEMDFLVDYFNKNSMDNIELIEVSFEYSQDDAKNISTLKKYRSSIPIDFTLLYGGRADKKITSEKFPQLTKILSYPTLVFVDKDNIIRYIHTGFAGPATSEYKNFTAKFDQIINALKSES